MERRKGTFCINDASGYEGRFSAISVTKETVISALNDSNRKALRDYVSDDRSAIPVGTIITPQDGAVFKSISLTSGAVDLIF